MSNSHYTNTHVAPHNIYPQDNDGLEEHVVGLWETLYCDDGPECELQPRLHRYAALLKRSFQAAARVLLHMSEDEIAPSDQCSRFVQLYATSPEDVDAIIERGEDAVEMLEALLSMPQLLWYLAPRRQVTHCLPWSEHILRQADILPEDEPALRVFCECRKGASDLDLLAFFLRHEDRPIEGCSAADLLRRADALVENCASNAILFRWTAIPLKWRYYILRDSAYEGKSLLKQIAQDGLTSDSIMDALGASVDRVFSTQCDFLRRSLAPASSFDKQAVPLRWIIEVLEDVGVLLLPAHETKRSRLRELTSLFADARGTSVKRECSKLRRLLADSRSISTFDQTSREYGLASLRAALTSRAAEDMFGWMPDASVDDILQSLPINIRVRDSRGIPMYANRCAADSWLAQGTLTPEDRADDWAVLSDPSVQRTPVLCTNVSADAVRHLLMVKRRLGRPDEGPPYVIECSVDVTDAIAARDRFAQATAAVGIGLWHRQLDSANVWYSSGWKEMLGFSSDELDDTFETWSDRIHADDRPRVLAAMRDYVDGRSDTYGSEYRMLHKEPGRIVWIWSRGALTSPYGEAGPRFITGIHVDVTEYKSRGVFQREALDAMDDVYVFAKDRDFRFVYANKALVDALGKDPVGLRDCDLFSDSRSVRLFNETDERVFRSAFARVLGGQVRVKSRLCIAEEYFDDIKGRRRWLATVKQPLLLPDGQLHLLGISMDITELRLLKMYLDTLLHGTDDLVYVKELDGRFRMVSESFARAIGKTREQVEGKTDFDFFPKAYCEQWKKEEQEVARTRTAIVDSVRLVFGIGRASRIRVVTKVPVVTRDGDVEALIGIAKDVTDLVRERDRLWYGISKVQPLVSRGRHCVFVKDRFGRFVTWNEAFSRRHATHPTLLGRTDYDCWSAEEADRYRRDDRRVLESGCENGPYFEEQSRDGESRSMLLTFKAPLLGPEGRAIGLIGVYVDVTDRLGDCGIQWKMEVSASIVAEAHEVLKEWNTAMVECPLYVRSSAEL